VVDGPADGLDSGGVRRLAKSENALVLSAGTGEAADLSAFELSVGLARRGGAPAAAVLNARGSLPGARPNGAPRPRPRPRKR